MTRDEFEQTVKDICPHCKIGVTARQREDTKEFVHDIFRGTAVSHGICLATHYRNKWQGQLDG